MTNPTQLIEQLVGAMEDAHTKLEHLQDRKKQEAALTAARAHLERPASAPAAVSGWKLVPVEPTYGMLAAARRAYEDAAASLGRYTTDHAAYRAMLAAAPTGEQHAK